MKLRSADWTVVSTPHAEVRTAVERWHYSNSTCDLSFYSFGLFRVVGLDLFGHPMPGSKIFGGAIWAPPLRPAAEYVSRLFGVDRDNVLCLTRLAIAPSVGTNGASFVIGRSIRQIKKSKRWQALITYADDGQNHTGAIYRATNWTYDGQTTPRRLWVDPTGKLRSPKKGPPHKRKNMTVRECRARGWTQTEPHFKHRFIMRI